MYVYPSEIWTEQEYLEILSHERHMFAWCLVTYGDALQAEADAQALLRYPYEPAEEKFRGLLFHDEAWHWAMLHLFGEGYWRSRPELESSSREYKKESSRWDAQNHRQDGEV